MRQADSVDRDRRPNPLASYRALIDSPADRVRWACVLEAAAPKLGNVHPSASFEDLRFADFVTAGEALASVIGLGGEQRLGEMVLKAVEQCRDRTGTNVNLGIALLVVPLAMAERLAAERLAAERPIPERTCTRRAAIAEVLGQLDERDGGDVYAAIRLAQPGGLGRASRMDVRQEGPVDLLAAMRDAAERDLIALQYATGFTDLLDRVVPLVGAAISETGDLLLGVREAQLRLMAAAPDSLIARKCGTAVAEESQRRAAEVLSVAGRSDRRAAEERLDQWLRGDGHRRNPGTTADLIAASLYVLLGDG